MVDGRSWEAEQVAQTAVREFPLEIEPRLILAVIRTQDWRITEAKPVFEEIVRMDDRHACQAMLGYVYAYEGDLDRALAAMNRYAALLPPNEPDPIDCRGDVPTVNERYEEAAAAYQKNRELHPTWLEDVSCVKLTYVYLYQGKYALPEASAQARKNEVPAGVNQAEILGNIEVGRGRLDRAASLYEGAARAYATQEDEIHPWVLLEAAQTSFEQRQPEAALAVGRRHTSPWGAGVRGTAYLLLKNEAAAEKEFANLRSSAAPLLGDYMAGKVVELHRLLAAFYAGRPQEVIANWPQLGGPALARLRPGGWPGLSGNRNAL